MTKSAQNPGLRELLRVSRPKTRLSDLMLPWQVSEPLERLLLEQRERPRLAEHGLAPRRRLLLAGPPGTGKTSTASAVAGELKLPLSVISACDLLSCSPERAAGLLRLTFQAMANKRGVYLFDAFDTLGINQGAGGDAAEVWRLLGLLFQLIEDDDSDCICIVALNHLPLNEHPPTWRFDDIIQYERPHPSHLAKLIAARCSGFLPKEVDYGKLVSSAHRLDYAAVNRACDDAMKEAVLRGATEISTYSLKRALEARPKD